MKILNNTTLLYNPDTETLLSIRGPLVRVDLVNIGEGLSGDYNPEDSDDEPLLRFDAYVKNDAGEWEELEDASYCTQISARASAPDLESAIRAIYSRYADAINRYPVDISVKKLGEELSWIARDASPSSPMFENVAVDMWYGDSVAAADRADVSFSDTDCLYRGNIYKGPNTIGDFATSDSTALNAAFPQLGFDWDRGSEDREA